MGNMVHSRKGQRRHVSRTRGGETHTCGRQASDVATATLAGSLQLSALISFHDPFQPPLSAGAGAGGANSVDGFLRSCRLRMSRSSISAGSFTAPNGSTRHRGRDGFLGNESDLPTPLPDDDVVLSASRAAREIGGRRSFR